MMIRNRAVVVVQNAGDKTYHRLRVMTRHPDYPVVRAPDI